MMALVFSKQSIGAKTFSGKLVDINDPDNPTDLRLNNVDRYLVVFRNPGGTLIEKTADVDPDIGTADDDFDIFFTTTVNDPVINAMTGYWEYTVGVIFQNGTRVTSPYWVGFYVVE